MILASAAGAQERAQSFESSKMNLNVRGERIQRSAATSLSYDLDAKTFSITSTEPEIVELMRGQMSRKIESQMGESPTQFSLRIESNTFVHFYLDQRAMIVITRDDVHPMQWGMMFKDVLPKN